MKKYVIALMVLCLIGLGGLAQAAVFTGGAGTTDWLDDANWDGTSPGNNATFATLYISAEVDYTATQGTTTETDDFHVGHLAGEVGILNLLGGTIQVNNTWGAIIGQQSAGTLNINGGDFIQQNDQPFRIGNEPTGNGTVNLISGLFQVAAVTQDWQIGRNGATGLLDISGGTAIFASTPTFGSGNGSINFTAGSTGSLTIAGADSTYYEDLYTAGNLTYAGANTSAFGNVFSVSGETLTAPNSGAAHTPDPSPGEDDVQIDLTDRPEGVEGAVSWQSPDVPDDDPNIVQVFGYNVYMDPNETNVTNATTATTGLLYKSLQSDGQTGTSLALTADLDYEKPYYWRVDAIVDFDTVTGDLIGDANTVTGTVWEFTTKILDAIPVVDAGDSIITTTALAAVPFVLEGSVENDETSPDTIGWQAFDVALGGGDTTNDKVLFADLTDPNTTVTISESGTYILVLTATDATGSVSDQKEIVVYDDACKAAKATGTQTANYYDRNDDCVVNLDDFVVFALEWLNSTALAENYFYASTVSDPTAEALVAEYWSVVGGDVNDLLNEPSYPDTPDGVYLVTGELRGQLDGNDSYGQRIRGYLVAPTTDDYTFYIASDDSARLFLSADTTPVDTTPALENQIAENIAWTDPDTWDTEASQASAPQSLAAGNYYYIEVLHKEDLGGDHVSVGWSIDGGAIEVIPGSALRYSLP